MIIIKILILTKSPTKMLRLVIMLFMEAKHGLRQEMHYSYHHNCKNVQWDLEGRPETKTKPFDWRLRTEISFNNSWSRLRKRLTQQNNTTQTWLSGTTVAQDMKTEWPWGWPDQLKPTILRQPHCSQVTLQLTFLIYYELLSFNIRTSQFPFDLPVSHTLLPQILLSSSR